MPVNSKQKGNAGEREIAKLLSEIFGGSFIRVPGSGSYVGGKNTARKQTLSNGQIRTHKGDIIPPDNMPRFVAEIKSRKAFAFHQLLGEECAELDDWLTQALASADDGDSVFVIFKINRLGWFVAAPSCQPYTLANHARYRLHGQAYAITQAKAFFTDNRATIMAATC